MDCWKKVITYIRDNSKLLNKGFEIKSIEKKSKTPNQHLYISYTVKNPDFIIQFNREKKN